MMIIMMIDDYVIHKVKTGSGHRLVRGTLNINVKLERSRLMKSTLRPSNAHIGCPESFQIELSNRCECLENSESVDEINNRFVETVHAVGSKFYRPRRKDRPQKLTDCILRLMAERRAMVLQTSADAKAHRQLNRQIWKSLRHDIRNFNVNMVKEAIERNQCSKVFARNVSIGQSQLTKLKAEDGSVASTKAEVLWEIETF